VTWTEHYGYVQRIREMHHKNQTVCGGSEDCCTEYVQHHILYYVRNTVCR